MTEEQKSPSELKRIFVQPTPPPGWDAAAWTNEREHALGEYWRPRLAGDEPLTSAELEELLACAELEPALGVIGDAARMGLLSEEHCVAVLANRELDRYAKAPWAKQEIRLRQAVNELRRETSADVRRGLLDKILHQTRYWALQATLEHMGEDDLQYCESTLSDRSVLTRSTREEARQAIRRIRERVTSASVLSSLAENRGHRHPDSLRVTHSMSYAMIELPFALDLWEKSKKDLEAYRVWFHEVGPTRIAELAKAVKSTPGYGTWEASGTVESLEALGLWFEGQVETRKKTASEMEAAKAKLTFPIDIPEDELTDRTLSLVMDMGMYFGEVILRNLAGTRWDQPLRNKNFVDYGHPVIAGFGKVTLNPVRVILMTAYGIARKKPRHLRELYETWAAMRG